MIRCYKCKRKVKPINISDLKPLPLICSYCMAYCCPICGGKMGKEVYVGNEMTQEIGTGCNSCDYTY